METITDKYDWEHTVTGQFNGIPCEVIEEIHIVLDKQGKATRDFVDSEEFRVLERAGIAVHSGAYS